MQQPESPVPEPEPEPEPEPLILSITPPLEMLEFVE